jgi:hypothetical protein
MAPITLTTARLDQVMTRERACPAACATPTCRRSPSVCAARRSMMLGGVPRLAVMARDPHES